MQTVCDNLQKKKREEKENKLAAGQQRGRRTIGGNCWSCGKPGHMQIHCSESQASGVEEEKQPTSQTQQNPGKLELARLARQSLAGESNAPQSKDVFKTGAGPRPTNGLCAVGAIGGNQCRILVDTGSNITSRCPQVSQNRCCPYYWKTLHGDWRDGSSPRKEDCSADRWHLSDTTCSVGGRDGGRVHPWDGLPSDTRLSSQSQGGNSPGWRRGGTLAHTAGF